MIGSKPPVSAYLIYAQKDEALKQEFEDYLVIMQQDRLIAGWVERQVQPGKDWLQIIDPHLLIADLVLLLVSPSLLASGYCSGAEFRQAFDRNNKTQRKAALVPILLHQVKLTGHPLETILCVPRRQPVSSWPER